MPHYMMVKPVGEIYSCPHCRRTAQPIRRHAPNGNGTHIGVRHTDDCPYYQYLLETYPILMKRIQIERNNE